MIVFTFLFKKELLTISLVEKGITLELTLSLNQSGIIFAINYLRNSELTFMMLITTIVINN